MIDLIELHSITDVDELEEYLEAEENGTYEVYIPKTTQSYYSEQSVISADYAQLAFSGQMLKEIAGEFKYEVVTPDIDESVLFILGDVDKAALASVLLKLAVLYGVIGYAEDSEEDDEQEDEEDNYTSADIEQFMTDVEEGNIVAACPEFVAISKEQREDEEEGEEDE